MDVWSIISLVVSLDTKSTALSMKERLGLQKGKPDWGELWQSTDGKGSNPCPLLGSLLLDPDEVDELDSSRVRNTKNKGTTTAINSHLLF